MMRLDERVGGGGTESEWEAVDEEGRCARVVGVARIDGERVAFAVEKRAGVFVQQQQQQQQQRVGSGEAPRQAIRVMGSEPLRTSGLWTTHVANEACGGETTCVAADAERGWFAAGDGLGGVTMWSARTLAALACVGAHGAKGVTAMAFSKATGRLVTGGADGRVRLWRWFPSSSTLHLDAESRSTPASDAVACVDAGAGKGLVAVATATGTVRLLMEPDLLPIASFDSNTPHASKIRARFVSDTDVLVELFAKGSPSPVTTVLMRPGQQPAPQPYLPPPTLAAAKPKPTPSEMQLDERKAMRALLATRATAIVATPALRLHTPATLIPLHRPDLPAFTSRPRKVPPPKPSSKPRRPLTAPLPRGPDALSSAVDGYEPRLPPFVIVAGPSPNDEARFHFR